MLNPVPKHCILEREHYFHSIIEITRHPVGNAQVDLFLAAVCEVKNTAELEKASNYASDPHMVANPSNPGTQSAHAAHNEIDFYASLGCTIKRHDYVLVYQGVHLGDNASLETTAGM